MVVNKGRGFKELIVWQRAKELVVLVYNITAAYPKSETFGLVSQMRRASISVISQIAEGYFRKSIKDKKRFLEIANGSLLELESDVEVSLELRFINQKDYLTLSNKIGEVGFLLSKYFNSF